MESIGTSGAGEAEAGRPARLSRTWPLVRAWSRFHALRPPSRAEIRVWWCRQMAVEESARSAFFLVPVGLMIGIVLVHASGWRPGLWAAALPAILASALAWRLSGRGWKGALSLLLACVAAGVALATVELRFTRTVIFSGEATVRIEGRVLWRDRDEKNRMRYILRIEKTERPTLSRPPETASILVSSRHDAIPVGGRLRGLVRLRAPSGPAYPGAYDFAFGPYFDGRGANGFALGPPEPAEAAEGGLTVGEHLVTLRLWMSDRIRDVVGGGAGAVASALITGERSGIPDDINDWLRATGLSHVLSISGLHMALVAGFAMVLVRGALAAVPGAALVLPTKKIAAVAALLVATAYLVISGSNVATDRSFVMLSIMLLAVLADRPALTLRNVGIAALVVLVTTPHVVVTASFQMSFSATVALVGVYGAYTRWRAEREGDDPKRQGLLLTALVFLAGLAASSAIAGTATAPYAAYHFQRIAPYGVIANLVALPVFSFWIMPLALIAVLLMPFGLDAPFLALIGGGLDLVFAMARLLATHLPDAPSGRLTPLGLGVVSVALLVGCLSASRLRWIAIPVGAVGLALLPSRSAPPELLVFEDGRELAVIDGRGRLHPLRPRPNDFVFDQWERAFGARAIPAKVSATSDPASFACKPSPLMDPANEGAQRRPRASPPADPAAAGAAPARPRPEKPRLICKATTRSGLRIVWTDDYRLAGTACDEADIAIVARAIALDACRSGARLVTLRTLRKTGSLAVSGDPSTAAPIIATSIGKTPEEWNRHRLAPWPEHWRNPVPHQATAPSSMPLPRSGGGPFVEPPPAASGTGLSISGSAPPGDPAP